MKTVLLNRFDAGIANDPRTEGNVARVITNFDALTNPHKLTPYHDSENGDVISSTSQKQNFAIALRTGTTYSLYGLGRQVSLNRTEVQYKDLTTTSNDLSDGNWNTPLNNQSATTSPSYSLFTYYKKKNLIYGAAGGNKIWAFSPSGSAWDDDVIATNGGSAPSFTTICEGVVHSKDNILYIGYDNKVMLNNNGAWTIPVLTLPDHFYITALAEHQGFLAIAAAPLSGVGSSRVYLWDRDSLFGNIPEIIDWGDGVIKVLKSLNGSLVGISIYGGTTTRFKTRISFKQYTGYGAQQFAVLEGATADILTQASQLIDNRLHFMMSTTLNGAVREGVWSVGKLPSGAYSIIHEYTPNNDTALSSGVLYGFIKVGDYVFQAYQTGGAFAVSKTNDQPSYTATAIYETKVNPNMPAIDAFQPKKFGAAGLFSEKLTGSQQLVLKRKVDGGSYVTVFTKTTTSPDTDLIGYDSANDTSGSITDGREIEFRIESTGGAVPTGLAYRYDTKASNLFPK